MTRLIALGRSRMMAVAKAVLVLLAVAFILFSGTERLGYHWQWYRVPQYLLIAGDDGFTMGPLLNGLVVTVEITGVSLVLSLALGLVSALFRLSGSVVARAVSRAYLEAIRNTPLLVQIFFIYFVASPVLGIGRFASAVLALSLFEGAYISEIIRAGILSVPGGQWDAALSIGMGRLDAYRSVILPQAVRHALPPLTGQAISLIKDSALVSTIAVYDLTMRAQAIIAETYLTFELWFTVAALYLLMTLSLSVAASFMERRFRMKGT
jgi:polar amino acid transport system permease protein